MVVSVTGSAAKLGGPIMPGSILQGRIHILKKRTEDRSDFPPKMFNLEILKVGEDPL